MARVKFRVMVKLRIKVMVSVSGELSPGGGSKGLTLSTRLAISALHVVLTFLCSVRIN